MINCVYLHIPFCKKKCKYCAFCSFSLLKDKDKYIQSLIKEIKFYYKNEKLKTLYFGGGTPSILDIKDFEIILNCFNYDKNTELTIEANPQDIIGKQGIEKLKNLKNLGANRISLGIQSFEDKILAETGREHNKKEALEAFENIKKEFNNISIDLMYGLPNQTEKIWEKTLDKAQEMMPSHISLYGLKIEKGTFYEKFPPKNLPDDNIQAKMYEMAIKKLNNYLHYEFSNFAINKKYISKHNSAYWERKNYYGFGLSASGFIENKRYTNTFNLKEYILNPQKKSFDALNIQQQIEEEIFLGLRMSKGIDFKKINQKFNTDIYKMYEKIFKKYLNSNHLIKTKNGVKLSVKGILVSNIILSDFIKI